jgi:hypothetical protein
VAAAQEDRGDRDVVGLARCLAEGPDEASLAQTLMFFVGPAPLAVCGCLVPGLPGVRVDQERLVAEITPAGSVEIDPALGELGLALAHAVGESDAERLLDVRTDCPSVVDHMRPCCDERLGVGVVGEIVRVAHQFSPLFGRETFDVAEISARAAWSAFW